MNECREDRSTRFARWWVARYTAGLPDGMGASRRAEIESDMTEHARCRRSDGWTSEQISRERRRRLTRGVAADLGWRHDMLASSCRLSGSLRLSLLSVTTLAALMLALFHFAFAAYLLGSTSIADRRFLGGLDNYADEVGRPVASVVAAMIISSLGVVLLIATLARPVSPVVANAATISIAAVAVMFFWLGAWPIALVTLVASTVDLGVRTPTPTS